MAQDDYAVANQTAAQFRTDVNNQLAAIVSLNSGATAPSTTYAFMWWHDTANAKLKKRNAADDAWITIFDFDETNDTIENITVDNITNAVLRAVPYRYENLGVTLSGGVLTLAGYDGTALSATNPGYICLPSNATPGNCIVFTITANLTIDESDMTGNTMGTTASTAYNTYDLPLYLAIASSDSDAGIAFGLTRIPNIKILPADTSIGDPSAANADAQDSFFSGQDITETTFDGNNVFAMGAIVAKKDASDQWTFGTLVKGRHGLGLYDEETRFYVEKGQYGANSGTHTAPNGGTAAVFSTSVVSYRVKRDGVCILDFSFRGDGGTDGSGAVAARFSTPYAATEDIDGVGGSAGYALYQKAGGNYVAAQYTIRNDTNHQMFLWDIGSTGTVNWADFTNGTRAVWGTAVYNIRTNM